MTGVVTTMHCNSFLETCLTFEVPASFIPFPSSAIIRVRLPAFQGKIRVWEVSTLCLLLRFYKVCYVLKHLEDRKALPVHIYHTWCDIILIFKPHRRTRITPRSSIHSLEIRMTSHPCNKYKRITPSYSLSVKEIFQTLNGRNSCLYWYID